MSEHVLVVTQQLGEVRTGVGTYAEVLVRGLRDRGLRVTVATFPAGVGAVAGVEYVAVRRRPWDPTPGGWLSLALGAGRLGARLGVRLVHYTDAREALVHRGPPGVGTAHDAYAVLAARNPWPTPDPWRRRLYYGWLRRAEARAYRRLALLFANSEAVRRAVVAAYGLSPLRTEVVRLAVEVPAVRPQRLPGAPSVLTAGQNPARKGLDTMLRAVQHTLATLPGLHLHVVGGERQYPHFVRRIRRLGVASRVTLHGPRPRNDLLALVAGADLVCLPSYAEGYGLLLVEAMALGTPVVAARAGGIPELVRDGVNGLLVEPGDAPGLARAWRRLLGDAGLRRRLVAGGRATAAAHTPEALVTATLRGYERLAVPAPRPVWAA